MKVVLIKEVKKIGQAGDVKEVSDGYARNFLFPKGLAEPATEKALKRVEAIKKSEAERQKENLEKNQAVAALIQGKEILIKAKTKDDHLFGSVGSREIAKALKKENVQIDPTQIALEEPIKEAGEYQVMVKLDHGLEAELTVVIEGDK